MPAGCENTCPKVKRRAGSTADLGPFNNRTADLNGSSKSVSSSRRSPSQSQKAVRIGVVTAVELTDSRSTGSSDNTTSVKDSYTSTSSATKSAKRPIKTSPQGLRREERNKAIVDPPRAVVSRSQDQTNAKSSTRSIPRKEYPQRFEQPSNHSRMSSRAGNSSGSGTRADWNPNGHDPCPPSCPTTQARDRATRKAESRQERLDYYLLNKGFRYFDDLCTCSSFCLVNQLKRDRFVLALLKSAFLFGIGMKLCEELDAWNIIG